MKKIIYCDGCKGETCNSCSKYPVVTEKYVCDTCGNHLPIDDYSYVLSIIFQGEENTYDFCNLKCASKFISAELTKETK